MLILCNNAQFNWQIVLVSSQYHLAKQQVKKPVFLRFMGVLDVIPTRRVKSISKLFCIEDLIRRGFI